MDCSSPFDPVRNVPVNRSAQVGVTVFSGYGTRSVAKSRLEDHSFKILRLGVTLPETNSEFTPEN